MLSIFCLLAVGFAQTIASPTIDERFRALGPDQTLAVAKLLCETFSPPMNLIAADVQQDPRAVARLAPSLKTPERGLVKSHPALTRLGYRGLFLRDDANQISFTPYNAAVARRWARAVRAVEIFVASNPSRYWSLPSWAESQNLLTSRTYGKMNFATARKFGNLTVESSVAQLTAEPVGDRTAGEMLTQILSHREYGRSLVVDLAVIMIPEFLARTGAYNYSPGALVEREGVLVYSAPLETLFDQLIQIFRQKATKQPYELGHGCPLGRRLRGQPKSSLQNYLEAILAVYAELPEEDCEFVLTWT